MLTVGMNCALGPQIMRPHLEELAKIASVPVSCHPNAGLPNEMGQYDLGPTEMAQMIGEFCRERLAEYRWRLLWYDTGSHCGDR